MTPRLLAVTFGALIGLSLGLVACYVLYRTASSFL